MNRTQPKVLQDAGLGLGLDLGLGLGDPELRTDWGAPRGHRLRGGRGSCCSAASLGRSYWPASETTP